MLDRSVDEMLHVLLRLQGWRCRVMTGYGFYVHGRFVWSSMRLTCSISEQYL